MDALSSFVYGRSEKYDAENFSVAERNRSIPGDSNNNSFPLDMTSMAHSSTCCAIHSNHENGVCDGNSNYDPAEKSREVPQTALPINYSPHAFHPFPTSSIPQETGKSAEASTSSTSYPIAHSPHPFQLYRAASPSSMYPAGSSMQTGTLNKSCYPIPSYPVYGCGKSSDTASCRKSMNPSSVVGSTYPYNMYPDAPTAGQLIPTSQIHFISSYAIMKPKCVSPNCCYSANSVKYLPCLSTQKSNYKMLNPNPQSYTTHCPNYRPTTLPASKPAHTSGTGYSVSDYHSDTSENANLKEDDTGITSSDNENNDGISSEESNPEIGNYQNLETRVDSIVPENREECIFPDNTNGNDEKNGSISESKTEKSNEVITITIGDLLCETLAKAKKNQENKDIKELNADSAKSKKNIKNQMKGMELNVDSIKVEQNQDNQKNEEINAYSNTKYLDDTSLKEKSDKNSVSNPEPKNLSLEKYNPKTLKKVPCKEKSRAERPPLSYVALIREAILSSPEKRLTLEYIYSYIVQKYEYFRTCGISWKNSIRHNLSLNKCFTRIVKEGGDRKGGNWTYDSRYDSQFQNNNFRRRTRMRRCPKSVINEPTTSSTKPLSTSTVKKTYPSPYPQQYLSYSANFMAHNCRFLAPDDKSYPLAHMSNTMLSSDRSTINTYPTYAQRIQAQRMQDLHVRYVHSHQINSTVLPSVPTTLTVPSAYSGNSYASRASNLGYTSYQPLQEHSWGAQDNRYHPY